MQQEDYPFSNWKNYYSALVESLTIGYDSASFPVYNKKVHFDGTDSDINIIRTLLENGNCPHEGLHGFIDTIVKGSRYAKDLYDTGIILEIVILFMRHNAIPKIESIFEPTYLNDNLSFEENKILFHGKYITFEDEVIEYDSRGFILDALAYAYPDLDLTYHIDWTKIVSTIDWEDIPTDGTYTIKTARYMYLKSKSNYLKSFKNENDNNKSI